MFLLKSFTMYIECKFQKMEVDINGEYLNHLRLTANIEQISDGLDEWEGMLNDLNRESIKI